MAKAADTAYSKIRQGILSGHFEPGQHLKEAELVEYCGVSRTPVRAALHRLDVEDFVDAQSNQGVRVRDWSDEDVEELFELRTLLEGYAASKAAANISAADLDAFSKALESMDQVLVGNLSVAKKTIEFLKLNGIIHNILWAATGSERLVGILSLLVDQSLQVRTAQAFDLERIAQSHHHHQELLAALKVGDGVWAEAVMRSHIRAARVLVVPAK